MSSILWNITPDHQEPWNQLESFLHHALTELQDKPDGTLISTLVNDVEKISIVKYYHQAFITGTDILKMAEFRLKALGFIIQDYKKFEEYVFSLLRHYQSILEESKSLFINFLFESGCIRSHKKQKVFLFEFLNHRKLFQDVFDHLYLFATKDVDNKAMETRQYRKRPRYTKPVNIGGPRSPIISAGMTTIPTTIHPTSATVPMALFVSPSVVSSIQPSPMSINLTPTTMPVTTTTYVSPMMPPTTSYPFHCNDSSYNNNTWIHPYNYYYGMSTYDGVTCYYPS